MEDSMIIEMYWNRNESAIEETDKKYGSYCFAVANNILNSKEDSEECVNDTWLRAWNAIPPKKPERFRVFLARITRNLSFDKYKMKNASRRKGEMLYILDELSECISSGSTADDELDMKLLSESINGFLKTISERDRTVFLRRYFYAEAVTEIAERMSITPNNVSAILARSRAKLREHLTKEGFEI